MFEYKPPSLSYLSLLQCHFHNGQICDFSVLPRPFFIISFVNIGNAIFKGSSGTITLAPRDIFFIPMGETYISEWSGNTDMYCTSIFFKFQPNRNPINDRNYPLQKINVPEVKKIEKIFGDLLYQKNENGFFSFSTISSFYFLCDLIFQKLYYKEKVINTTIIKNALDYIEKNYNSVIPIKKLAELCHLSESRFYHVFRDLVGVSPIKYKNDIAINCAQLYLQCDTMYTIEEISEKCGFSSSIYFRRVFKKATGKSPKEFKKQTIL